MKLAALPQNKALGARSEAKPEYAVRATIEAYSNGAMLEGREEVSACGLLFAQGAPPVRLLVTSTDGQRYEYAIDRLD